MACWKTKRHSDYHNIKSLSVQLCTVYKMAYMKFLHFCLNVFFFPNGFNGCLSAVLIRKSYKYVIIIIPTSCTNFSNLFWNKTLHVWTVPLSIIRSFFTVHTVMTYIIEFCWQLANRIRTFRPHPARKLSANLYDIYHCSVYSEKKLLMMDTGTVRTCRVLFQK